MRTFWIILGVLVLVGVAAALMPGITARSSKPAMNSPPVNEWAEKKQKFEDVSAPMSGATTGAVKEATINKDAAATESAKVVAEAKPAVAPAEKPKDVTETTNPVKESKPDAIKPDTTKPIEAAAPDAGVQDVIETALNAGKPPETTPTPVEDGKVELKQTPVKIERKEDGSVVLDGQFTVKGNGTKESPYIAPWELVLTAQDTYDPGQKKDEVPGAVMFLHGKHVRLTGYVCFPMYVPEPKEMLAMLNQWDGCCIGVPPSPYDAVEVHLSKKVGTDDRYAVYGSVEGVFYVKPYLSGNWLIGLYLLEEATFKPSDKGGGN